MAAVAIAVLAAFVVSVAGLVLLYAPPCTDGRHRLDPHQGCDDEWVAELHDLNADLGALRRPIPHNSKDIPS